MSAPTPARRVAYEVLRRVFEHDSYADRALRSAARRAGLEGRERAQAQRLAYGAVQRRGTSDRIAGKLARRPASKIDPPLLAALRLGLFELLYDDAVAEHAAVDQAVALAKGEATGAGRDPRRERGAGLVNAVLRRAAEQREKLLASQSEETVKGAAAMHSIPRWIAELWWKERGPESARALMAASNRAPKRTVRVSERRRERSQLEAALRDAGVELGAIETDLPGADRLLEVSGGLWDPVEAAIGAGELIPQSAGSAAAAALVGAGPGQRILDLCAAPGIKTTQLAEDVGPSGAVVAIERDSRRAAELERLCERVGVDNVEVRVGDGTRLDLGSGYDRVLVDAPCSGLGTLASRPDLRWRRSPQQIGELIELQAGLIEAGAGALAPGGALTYSICTISRAEGEGVVARSGHSDLGVDPLGPDHPGFAADPDGRFLQLLPDRDDTDGFFIARLRRGAEA